MALVINDYVVETASNPGTGTVNLAGAATGRRTFVDAIGSGNTCYYYITDGTQAEWGIGTVTAGTPNTLSRDTVLSNTSGTTSKLNFTGSVTVYCELPTAKRVVKDASGNIAENVTLQSSDAGATIGPSLTLDRASASPAAADVIGGVVFKGRDSGAGTDSYAQIQAEIDDPTAASEDGRLALHTAVAGTLAARVTVKGADVGIGQAAPAAKLEVENDDAGKIALLIDQNQANAGIVVQQADASNNGLFILAEHASFANNVLALNANRSATTSYNFIIATSDADGTPDTEFKVTGDGTVSGDGAAYVTPADYAEFFETIDGAPIAPGTSVVLSGHKVRAATLADDPAAILGVVRPKQGNVSVTCNTAEHRWSGKYVRDDFGAPILEAGRRKVSPGFEADRIYVPRRARDEWVVVGLLGQIPLRKGQPAGARWIKMGDVSDTVELWMVR